MKYFIFYINPFYVYQDKGSPRRSEKGTVTIVEDADKGKFEPKAGSSKQPTEEEMSLLSDDTDSNFMIYLLNFLYY